MNHWEEAGKVVWGHERDKEEKEHGEGLTIKVAERKSEVQESRSSKNDAFLLLSS